MATLEEKLAANYLKQHEVRVRIFNGGSQQDRNYLRQLQSNASELHAKGIKTNGIMSYFNINEERVLDAGEEGGPDENYEA